MPTKITFPGKGENNPFAEQLDFFMKKLNLPTDRYDDILRSAHDKAFVVAGAANADLLNDLRGAVQKSIEEGRGLEVFRKDFNQVVLKNGWVGWTGEGSAGGNAWRTRVIYQTNMSTSYAAGRWQQLNDPGLLSVRPYWRYIHDDTVDHPRPLHLSWHNLVLPHDHEFWKTHFAPNGWGCQCRITSADAKAFAAAQDAGKGAPPKGWDEINPRTGAPVGIDKGFDYAPGASAGMPLKQLVDQKLLDLSSPVGAAMYEAVAPVIRAEAAAAYSQFLGEVFADPVRRGRVAIVGAVDPATLTWLRAEKGIEPVSAEIAIADNLVVGKKAARHQAAGDALTEAQWASLPVRLAEPEQVLFDPVSGKLIFIISAEDGLQGKLAVELGYRMKKVKGEVNMVVSAFKVLADTIQGNIKGGVYEVIR